MQDTRQIEAIRSMTPSERWEMWIELSRLGMELWESNLTPEEIDRRWAIWRREHDASNDNMLRGFREADRK
jgi:hypothetical protein